MGWGSKSPDTPANFQDPVNNITMSASQHFASFKFTPWLLSSQLSSCHPYMQFIFIFLCSDVIFIEFQLFLCLAYSYFSPFRPDFWEFHISKKTISFSYPTIEHLLCCCVPVGGLLCKNLLFYARLWALWKQRWLFLFLLCSIELSVAVCLIDTACPGCTP